MYYLSLMNDIRYAWFFEPFSVIGAIFSKDNYRLITLVLNPGGHHSLIILQKYAHILQTIEVWVLLYCYMTIVLAVLSELHWQQIS